MQTDYPELRAWLAQQENFEANMKRSPWICTIKDNQALDAVQMLDWNHKIQPSSIVVIMSDGSYREFWDDVYHDQKNVPYDLRLPTYSASFLIY
jgi:hypothetical protein